MTRGSRTLSHESAAGEPGPCTRAGCRSRQKEKRLPTRTRRINKHSYFENDSRSENRRSVRLLRRDQADRHRGRTNDGSSRRRPVAIAASGHVQDGHAHVAPLIDLVDEDLQESDDRDVGGSARSLSYRADVVDGQGDDGTTARDRRCRCQSTREQRVSGPGKDLEWICGMR